MAATSSLWIDTVKDNERYKPLNEDLSVDIAIIGGGITGLVSAYRLAKAGKRVAVFEKETIASAETGYTTAFLTQVFDFYLYELHGKFGDEKTKISWQAQRDAIDYLEEIIKEETIDCDFMRCPAFIYAHNDDGKKDLEKEVKFATELGFKVDLKSDGLSFAQHGYMEVPDQAKFHPRKFLIALAEKITAHGGLIFEKTKITDFEGDDKTILVSENGNRITAHDVIIATHSPMDNRFELPARMFAYQTYIIESKIPKSELKEALYWDTRDPYYYFRIDPLDEKYDRIIFGGEDHETGKEDDTDKNFEKLLAHAKSLFPDISAEITRQWSGQVFESADGMPFIGRSVANKHHYITGGYAGNGMTFGTAAAILNSDLIINGEHPWEDAFSPKRLKGILPTLKLGATFVKDLIAGRIEHHYETLRSLAPGQGRILDEGMRKIAVYKKKDGEVIACDATCTHLGCVVAWNKAGESWDCPCHGSRFTPEGEVMNGPAVEPLKRLED